MSSCTRLSGCQVDDPSVRTESLFVRRAIAAPSEAQASLDKGLTGNSRSAIENRETVLNLVSGYQDYLKALAASGADQSVLNSEAQRLRNEFIQQATQLGFNSAELGVYASQFDNVTIAIQKVPRNITVKANANPAIQALNEALAQMRKSASSGVSVPMRPSYASGARSLAQQQAEEYRSAFMRYMRNRPIAIEGPRRRAESASTTGGTTRNIAAFSST